MGDERTLGKLRNSGDINLLSCRIMVSVPRIKTQNDKYDDMPLTSMAEDSDLIRIPPGFQEEKER